MKKYSVLTKVETIKGIVFTGDPVELTEKEFEALPVEVNLRRVIKVTLSTDNQIKHKFIPINNIHVIEVFGKEIEEVKK